MKIRKANRILTCALNVALLLCVSLFGGPALASQLTIAQLFAFACDSTGKVCPNGQQPYVLIESADGNLYGTTLLGGTGNQAAGTVFKITPSGQLTTLYTFVADQNGHYPNGQSPDSLVEGDDGFLYGTTTDEGTVDPGVVFKLSKTGAFQVLYRPGVGGAYALTLGADGNLYGCGFPTDGNFDGATVFRLTPRGVYQLLHTFDERTEGPGCIGITQASDGSFYGTTRGALGIATTLFRLTPAGNFTSLHAYRYPQFPVSAPIQASDARIYGALSQTRMFVVGLSGNGYKEISLSYGGSFFNSVIHLVDASDGNFWATDPLLGASGAIVSFTRSGNALQELDFDSADGAAPDGLLQAGDGTLFGVALQGGSVGQGNTANGVVFSVNAGLPAPKPLFVTFTPSHGGIGSKVTMHGVHFVGANAVTFNGVSASFTVLNTGNILATVPAGASTGPIAVTNAGGTTESVKDFVVD